jgi:hypothetical protein
VSARSHGEASLERAHQAIVAHQRLLAIAAHRVAATDRELLEAEER